MKNVGTTKMLKPHPRSFRLCLLWWFMSGWQYPRPHDRLTLSFITTHASTASGRRVPDALIRWSSGLYSRQKSPWLSWSKSWWRELPYCKASKKKYRPFLLPIGFFFPCLPTKSIEESILQWQSHLEAASTSSNLPLDLRGASDTSCTMVHRPHWANDEIRWDPSKGGSLE